MTNSCHSSIKCMYTRIHSSLGDLTLAEFKQQRQAAKQNNTSETHLWTRFLSPTSGVQYAFPVPTVLTSHK